MQALLLVELLTEELPPKSLAALGASFAGSLRDELIACGLAAKGVQADTGLATPRRLAVLIPDVLDQAAAEEREVTGPATNAPAAAVAGFARKHGVSVESLERRQSAKGEVFAARAKAGGAALDAMLPAAVEKAIKKLPIQKVMRWGAGEAQFVRPVHGLVMLHGARVVPGSVLGIASGNRTRGHRFMGTGEIVLARSDEYVARLADDGKVIASFQLRRSAIEKQLRARSAELEASLGDAAEVAALLDEVTALVEHPSVYAGTFPEAFLDIPQECLILTMRQNQKYFPLFGPSGALLPRFLIVSNMQVADPSNIIRGNERVVRPRLEDARFFYDQDRRQRLESRVPELAKVVYHNKLGSQLQRVERIRRLAGHIARALGGDAALAERAAWLCKADLLTGMVGEFPELQGVMGSYYARHDGEPAAVAEALDAHYRPRFAGDRLPEGPLACAVALADKLDTLVGIFGAGQAPTGEKDPFGLRRSALGVLRILMERRLALDLRDLLEQARAAYPDGALLGDAATSVATYIYERLHHMLREQGYAHDEVEAVVSQAPGRIDLVPSRLQAVREFKKLPEAESLAAANKRIGNILKQAGSVRGSFDASLMLLAEEKALSAAFEQARPRVDAALGALDYTGALKALAALKAPVDAFFDKVMVMDKDERLRANRIGFLGSLHGTMNRIADLSKLAQ